jgi:bifunctional DNase/RNase
VTTLRIAHAGHGPAGSIGHLVVLADDAGHRAVPVWVWIDMGAHQLSQLLELAGRPADQVITAGVPQELTTRLLDAAGARVTGVDIDVTDADAAELNQEVAVARLCLAGPAGNRQVTAALGLALALAAAAGAPVRLADAVLDRLAVPVSGDDPLAPFLGRVSSAAPTHAGHGRRPLAPLRGPRPRYEPRNLDFADGLERWDLDTWPSPDPDRPDPDRPDPDRPDPDQPDPDLQGTADGGPDYAAAAEGPSAVLYSAVPRPAWPAALVQAIYADDYRGATITFGGELRADFLAGQAGQAGQAGLRLEIVRHWWPGGMSIGNAREDHALTFAGRIRAWTRYELTVRIPADADLIRFGIGLTGSGRVALRNPDLRRAEPGAEPAPGTP